MRVDRRGHPARVHFVAVEVLRDRERRAANERVLQALAVDEHLAVVLPPIALIPELHAVRTGHIRGRRAPVRSVRQILVPALRPIRHVARDRGRRRRGGTNTCPMLNTRTRSWVWLGLRSWPAHW